MDVKFMQELHNKEFALKESLAQRASTIIGFWPKAAKRKKSLPVPMLCLKIVCAHSCSVKNQFKYSFTPRKLRFIIHSFLA